MSSQLSPQVAAFWARFVATQAVDPTPRLLEAFHFDDNQPSADELAELVLSGRKRATASLVWVYEAQGQRMPQTGDLSVVTRFDGTPVCVIETSQVEVVPYDEVSEEFAAAEGEGDATLRQWRDDHWRYFGRECARIGREPSLDMPVVCERFQVVFRYSTRVKPSFEISSTIS
jgi:uncharacterized protein YhfF